ncbi:hypothetical protein ACHM05_00185, partial [Staphylococcus aureus]|uniref:hypothetical protein n=1 Tax=Staphylococcus aureus TaxID=1280 RepID=UPI00375467B9
MNDIVKIIMTFLVINIIVDPFSLRYILRNKLIEYVDKKGRGQNIVYAYINFIELSIAPLKALMVDVKNAKLLFYMIMSQMVAVSYFVINLSAIMYMKQIGQLVFSVDMNIISIIIMDIVFVGLISSCL